VRLIPRLSRTRVAASRNSVFMAALCITHEDASPPPLFSRIFGAPGVAFLVVCPFSASRPAPLFWVGFWPTPLFWVRSEWPPAPFGNRSNETGRSRGRGRCPEFLDAFVRTVSANRPQIRISNVLRTSHTAGFSGVDPHRMMRMYGLHEGPVWLAEGVSGRGRASIDATRCRRRSAKFVSHARFPDLPSRHRAANIGEGPGSREKV
jgi:hypothetical protein